MTQNAAERSSLRPSERDILELEEQFPGHSSAKEQAILDTLGLSPARYYQLLHRLVHTKRGLSHNPVLAHRVQRMMQGPF